jgi:uncharacterized protein (TIGR02266 family)
LDTKRRERDAHRALPFQRVPLVRKCQLTFEDGRAGSAFLVNLSVVGVYLAMDDAPPLGARLSCRFSFPGNSREVHADGVVVWLNPRQQHPVHSLPPGIGLKFDQISEADRARIQRFVRDHAGRKTGHR